MIAGAIGLGLLIGLALGALGGGGSVLTVPALVFLLGMSAQEATTASLVIVGVTAAAASVGHARSGRTRWRTGLLLAALGVPASVLGSRLNQQVDQDVLLAAFAALMLLAATGMLLRARSSTEHEAPAAEDADSPGSTGSQDPRSSTRTLDRPRTASVSTRSRLRHALTLAAAGLGIGFLTGFLGVGGGFVIVPVLVVLLRLPMPVAVGTSLLVVSLNSAVALAARAGSGHFAWDVIVPFTLAAIVGSLAGKRVADRIRPARLTVAFAVLLVAVAMYVGTRAVLGLT
jgi:uncharacterized membrane protein YfcA